VLVSAIAGYVLILAFTFAIVDLDGVAGAGSFAAVEVLNQSLSETWAEILLAIAVGGQLFCGMSAVTSASRMLFAFSRDRAVPGWKYWSKLNHHFVPANAVILICVLAFLLAAPAWSGDAFFVYAAVTSVATIGLYVAYIIPVFLRLRAGESFDPGPWSLGRWHKPINVIAIIWVVFICVLFVMPVTDAGVWWGDDFDYKSANYAPVVFLIVLTAVTIWWHTSAKKWFKGPIRTIDEEIEEAVEEVDEPPMDAPEGPAPAPA
jgi:amino acid transporter